MFEHRIFETELAGRKLSVEIGKICEMTNGNCIIRYGDTMLMVNVTKSAQPRDGIDFFPLSVDFEEKLYSVGKIPGGFLKREGKPSEKAVLTSRLIDRPIRPLFPDGFRNDVQVVATVLSVDQDCTPDIVAMIGSSIALSISDIPFNGPTGSVLIGMVDGEFVVNPNQEQREKSSLHLVVSGTKDAIMMVEAGADEVADEKVLEAILFAHEEIKKIVEFIENIVSEVGHEKAVVELHIPCEELEAKVNEFARLKMREAVKTVEKMERTEKMDAVSAETLAHFEETLEDFEEVAGDIEDILHAIIKDEVRSLIVDENVRPDNRALDEIRNIWCETGMIPRTHGSAIFTRGQTQVLNVTTLGALGDVQKLDGLDEEDNKRYMHHYNFPSYSVGETRPSRGPGRREIGHGALAERALVPVIPPQEDFPYAIRLVSEVLSSNGSTSQASVCASTLSLLDAGVPIRDMVAGIAMGLIKHHDKVAVLSDIQGMEDHLGDMDFKVAGTEKGVTAIQMDIKIAGIDETILRQALKQAKEGRIHILNEMKKVISEPKPELSPYAPKIEKMTINPDKIRDVIGPGGKMINKIIDETGVKIDIEQTGEVFIVGVESEMINKAKAMIEEIVAEAEPGKIYKGRVVRLEKFGAFVEILPGKQGLLHISQISSKRVEKVEDVLAIDDEIDVMVTEIDDKERINLSVKAIKNNK
ncbi:MAG: polyribonucleotide nucleotidyltransferase [Peptostreptococcus porci]|uniref:Polyribonucleotide nucleotidyltransferase n=1 Tax=Peptostreptococcus porci TaxID=2652282 RepID=A0A6N7XF07_9FIRM|nr:polyribonucleotide nucleotidyltransferase [Peptostreptococcus porci]MDD7182306.1 polyribonucleotide nucleotidyltransferase [Peptostreptococcus porci]MDY2794114.1 polyribonucleotide nucleotidyltransferase [Peptostreptococcus porci]MDY4561528.1 polyribonucleotide nucleotidyltransferase [Peptostreptococcus porci]MDY5480551.1 polyribonucleotide nucleotidyltransferase [Peptostreptococcus porci]MST62183.1 polyribonucleotide nucleotidyltransferase [Peptostreptococcus porci]